MFTLRKDHGRAPGATPVRQTIIGHALLNYHTKFGVSEIIA